MKAIYIVINIFHCKKLSSNQNSMIWSSRRYKKLVCVTTLSLLLWLRCYKCSNATRSCYLRFWGSVFTLECSLKCKIIRKVKNVTCLTINHPRVKKMRVTLVCTLQIHTMYKQLAKFISCPLHLLIARISEQATTADMLFCSL